jgi:hypothetical protein
MNLHPRPAIHDALDLRQRDAEPTSQRQQCRGVTECANLCDRFRRQLRATITRAVLQGAVSALVVAVCLSSAPLQISQPVIERVAVQVSAFAAIWAGTTERGEHQTMGGGHDLFAISRKDDLFVHARPRPDNVRLAFAPVAGKPSVRSVARKHFTAIAHGVPGETNTVPRVRRQQRHVHFADVITVSRA